MHPGPWWHGRSSDEQGHLDVFTTDDGRAWSRFDQRILYVQPTTSFSCLAFIRCHSPYPPCNCHDNTIREISGIVWAHRVYKSRSLDVLGGRWTSMSGERGREPALVVERFGSACNESEELFIAAEKDRVYADRARRKGRLALKVDTRTGPEE